MKKLALLLIFALLVTTFLTAAGPPLRLVRLVVINKSGNVVYIKLTGSNVGGQFYYLTVDKGTKSNPALGWFTVVSDLYTRETTYGAGDNAACEGVTSKGQLVMDSNVRLTFTTCDVIPWRVQAWHWEQINGSAYKIVDVASVNRGEPRMEKVTYFKYVRFWGKYYPFNGGFNLSKYPDDFDPTFNHKNFGCGWYTWWVSTFRNPYRFRTYYAWSLDGWNGFKALCHWRYRY